MKLVSFEGNRIGALRDGHVVDLSDLVPADPGFWPPVGMVQLIAGFERLTPEIDRRLARGGGVPLETVRLEAPVKWPNKLIAYPANYQKHIEEMASSNRADKNAFFLKANSSISGPADAIVLPDLPGREIHHECELGIIIGRQGRHLALSEARSVIFGFCCLVDVVIRGNEERVYRKSFDSFCPIGPWIVTADEVPDPDNLEMELRVNGELRQKANTRDLIYDIPHMIAGASAAATLFPGDIIATGTPEGVGPIVSGDELTITIQNVGSMTLRVEKETAK